MGAQLGTALSVFSGAGGLDLGLEAAGIATLGCIELDPAARMTLEVNRPEWMTIGYDDVMEAAKHLRPKDLGVRRRGLDLIVGGPPCQPFSKAAQWSARSRLGMEDVRAQPIHGMLALIERFLPRAIIIENVAGFLQGSVSARAVIESGLSAINAANKTNYRLETAVLNAADYGAPQNRHRAIAVARRDGKSFIFPQPSHAANPLSAWDVLHDLPKIDWTPPENSWTELLPCIPEGGNYLHLTARGGGPEIFGWRTRYWSFLLKLSRERPSWTLPASPGPNTGPFHWDNRPLTIKERMRLQTFPDHWQLWGTDKARVRMSGNATPPVLAEVIGRAVVEQLQLGDKLVREALLASDPVLVRPAAAIEPGPLQPAELPARFRELVGSKAPHPGAGKGPCPREA